MDEDIACPARCIFVGIRRLAREARTEQSSALEMDVNRERRFPQLVYNGRETCSVTAHHGQAVALGHAPCRQGTHATCMLRGVPSRTQTRYVELKRLSLGLNEVETTDVLIDISMPSA